MENDNDCLIPYRCYLYTHIDAMVCTYIDCARHSELPWAVPMDTDGVAVPTVGTSQHIPHMMVVILAHCSVHHSDLCHCDMCSTIPLLLFNDNNIKVVIAFKSRLEIVFKTIERIYDAHLRSLDTADIGRGSRHTVNKTMRDHTEGEYTHIHFPCKLYKSGAVVAQMFLCAAEYRVYPTPKLLERVSRKFRTNDATQHHAHIHHKFPPEQYIYQQNAYKHSCRTNTSHVPSPHADASDEHDIPLKPSYQSYTPKKNRYARIRH